VDDHLAQLTAALRERLAIVADEQSRRDPEQHIKRLKEVSERLEEIDRRLPRAIDSQLSIYLQRRSYS
jgi:hypothetical protein